jgi:long-chain fatty acid transport protein
MKRVVPSNRILRGSVSAVLVAYCALAQGSGFALLEQSAARLGTAYAGSGAVSDDASIMFFNPAGLADVRRAQAIIVPSGILISSEFKNTASQAALAQPLGGNGGDAGSWNFVPSAYASMPLGDKLTFGVGINAPFGLKLEYDTGWIGRFQALNSEIQTINVNPTIAYRLNDVVSFGFGIDYQTIQAELTNSVNYTAVIAQGLQQLAAAGQLSPTAIPGLIAANSALEGHAVVRGDDHAWGFNFGVLFDVGAATRIGLSYRSAIDYEVEGSARFTSPFVSEPTGAAIIAAATSAGGPLATGRASVDLELPDSAVLSLRQGVGEQFALLADIAWTGWSSVQELRVVRDTGATLSVTPEEWEDTWRFSLGAEYTLSQAVKVRAGVALDEAPVPDSTRTPRLPDSDRTFLALGAQWQPSEMLVIDVGYAHLFTDDAPLNQNAGNTSAYGALIGNHESSVDIISAQFTLSF